jgi:hypothetical protein
MAAAVVGMAAVALGGLTTGVVGHADTSVPGINSCPNNNVYVAEYEGGPGSVELVGTGGAAVNKAVADADGNPSGSNVGDTVIVCPGTYSNVHAVVPKAGGDDAPASPGVPSGGGSASDTSKDNVTIRSFGGPGQTVLVTDGTGTPAFTVDANGVTIGGPGFGFTIENPSTLTSSQKPSSPLIEVGTPGAQSTANEDEMVAAGSTSCVTSGTGVAGCDQPTPTYVPINDAVIDNIITRLVPQNFTSSPVTNLVGIELDNTINNTVQSNLITNAVPDSAHVGTIQGIAVGSNANAGTTCSSCTSGYSTNVNTALFQNAVRQVTGKGSCTGLTAVSIDGFVLDSQVYNNLVGPLTSSSNCKNVVGIESNAYGQLENEQTGTLVPVNGNIDDNTISQLGPNNSGTGIVLDPQPTANSSNPVAGTPLCENPTATTCPNYPPSSYTVTDNQIQNVTIGVHVESLLGGNSYAHYTNFQNVKVGVLVDATAPTTSNQPETNFDATNNFWGCDDGPVSSDDNNCATISGAAYYNPWLASPVEGAGDEAGDNAGQS